MAAEAGGKVHVVDKRVRANDAVLVEGVVVVETSPCTGHLRGATTQQALMQVVKNRSLLVVNLLSDYA